VSTANITLDSRDRDALYSALKDVPRLAGLMILTDMIQSLRDTISRNVLIMTTIYTVLAVLIAFGVTYNGARIQLSERARELASLRILGFTRAEVSYILVGELMLLTLLAQPLGWALGALLALLMTQGFDSDLYTVPLVLERDTFALASLI
jgi:putative ABC transport system permease protein